MSSGAPPKRRRLKSSGNDGSISGAPSISVAPYQPEKQIDGLLPTHHGQHAAAGALLPSMGFPDYCVPRRQGEDATFVLQANCGGCSAKLRSNQQYGVQPMAECSGRSTGTLCKGSRVSGRMAGDYCKTMTLRQDHSVHTSLALVISTTLCAAASKMQQHSQPLHSCLVH